MIMIETSGDDFGCEWIYRLSG